MRGGVCEMDEERKQLARSAELDLMLLPWRDTDEAKAAAEDAQREMAQFAIRVSEDTDTIIRLTDELRALYEQEAQLSVVRRQITCIIESLQQLHALNVGAAELREAAQRRDYAAVAAAAPAVLERSSHFATFDEITQPIAVLVDQLQNEGLELLKAGGSAEQNRVAATLLDSLGEKARAQTAEWFCANTLKDIPDDSADVLRCYMWFKQKFVLYDASVFPTAWEMQKKLCARFCTAMQTHVKMGDIIKTLELAVQFEQEMEHATNATGDFAGRLVRPLMPAYLSMEKTGIENMLRDVTADAAFIPTQGPSDGELTMLHHLSGVSRRSSRLCHPDNAPELRNAVVSALRTYAAFLTRMIPVENAAPVVINTATHARQEIERLTPEACEDYDVVLSTAFAHLIDQMHASIGDPIVQAICRATTNCTPSYMDSLVRSFSQTYSGRIAKLRGAFTSPRNAQYICDRFGLEFATRLADGLLRCSHVAESPCAAIEHGMAALADAAKMDLSRASGIIACFAASAPLLLETFKQRLPNGTLEDKRRITEIRGVRQRGLTFF